MRLKTVVAACVLVAPFVPLFTAGCEPGEGFACGLPVPGSQDQIRRCDRALEICVCATHSCARREIVPASDAATWKRCSSGYRYVEEPFARPDLANRCVPQEHEDALGIIPGDAVSGAACPDAPKTQKDAGARDATLDVTDASGTDGDASQDASTEDAPKDVTPVPVDASEGSAPETGGLEAGADGTPSPEASVEGGLP